MPQITKGGKYIFGWSRMRNDDSICIPDEAVREYHLKKDEKVILISGSKTTGGFVVAKKVLVEQSKISGVFENNPDFARFEIEAGKTVQFKGRKYCWTILGSNSSIIVPPLASNAFDVKPGDQLLSIRGSNIGFVMGRKGPIIEKAREHPEIPVFS